ncbi:MAG TPA: CsgG/HfaB family protein [Spirochaetales bacterium]|nr:CsgG/HfaB family protein [Spirochaetales bacterium]HPM73951.1 CsgG/HfaB family protein [Spirochaetales bacterium]
MKHVLVVLAALSILAGPLSAQAERPLRVAVAEFQTKGEATFEDAGRIIPEWLIGSLSRIPEFDVVERVLLDRVLEEQGLALSGLVGEGGATAGALAGADAVVAGSVIAWAGSLSVTVRLIDATSGEVIRAVTLQDASPKSLPSELDGVARVLAGQQPASALRPPAVPGVKAKEYPVSVIKATKKGAALRVVIDRGLEDGIREKMAYAIMMPVYGASELSGDSVRVGMRRVGLVVVDFVEPNFAAGDMLRTGPHDGPRALVESAVAVPTLPFSMGLELGSQNLGGAFGQYFGSAGGIFGYTCGYEKASALARTIGGMSVSMYYVTPVLGNFLSAAHIGPGLLLGTQFMPEAGFGTAVVPVESIVLVAAGGFVEAEIAGFLVRAGARASLALGSFDLGYGADFLVDDRYVGLVVEPLLTVGYRLRLTGN